MVGQARLAEEWRKLEEQRKGLAAPSGGSDAGGSSAGGSSAVAAGGGIGEPSGHSPMRLHSPILKAAGPAGAVGDSGSGVSIMG